MVRNNQRTLMKEFVRYTNAFAEQSTRILTQVKDQSLQISHLVERLGDFMFSGLIELRNVHITDAGANQEMQVDAVTGYFITDHSELKRLLRAFALNADMDRSPLGTFQEISNITRTHVVGGFAIYRHNNVARTNAGAIQDHDRGLIAGETTFGKGLVQTVYPLVENTGLALTTAKYYTPSGRLIQRDYSNVSLYDYYYHREGEENNGHEIKLTDSGRTVYGGGGISPDVKIAAVKSNRFQDSLLQHYAFFNFAKHYVITHHPTNKFEVDDVVLQDFRKFLDEEKIPYTESDLVENNDWIRSSIRSEIFVDAFGQEEGLKVRAESDPQVIKALDLLPQAKALADNARRVVAERSGVHALSR